MMRRKCGCSIRNLALVVILVAMVTWLMTMMHADTLESQLMADRKQLKHSMTKLTLKANVCSKGNPNDLRSTSTGLGYNNFSIPRFLNNFKNPCFLRNVSSSSKISDTKLGCLPYFFIAGFPKSGTTDLWYRLLNHPDVKVDHVKEPMFFNKGIHKHSSFEAAADEYINFYTRTTLAIQRVISPASCHGPFPYRHIITGEGSVDTAFDMPHWKVLPGNEHCTEPVITNAHYVHQINPNMKIIFLVRNPTERLYSDYIYESRFFGYHPSAKDFHMSVLGAMYNFTQCTKHHSIRFCAYSNSLDTSKIRLRIGLYHIFIEDWLRVFDSKNIMVINADRTLGPQTPSTYREIFRFLDIRPFTPAEEAAVFSGRPINTRSKPERDIGDMLNKTRQKLDAFYEPFNKQLFKLNIL